MSFLPKVIFKISVLPLVILHRTPLQSPGWANSYWQSHYRPEVAQRVPGS